jgi:3-oxoisoapionate decarboxylase
MERREFIVGAALGTLGLSGFKGIPDFLTSRKMGIVVHSYWSRWNSKVESKNYPGFQNAIDLINHCQQIGAGGVQVGVKEWSLDFARKVRDQREKLGLYLEGSISLPNKPEEVQRFEQDVKNAKEAGAIILRTVASSGRRYEVYHSMEEYSTAIRQAIISLQLAEPIAKKYKVKIAVENHKDWHALELVDIIKKLDSQYIGVTLDFGNSIALLEDPMKVVEVLAPYIFSTHVKDMGVAEYSDGFLLSEVQLGKGFLDLKKMVDICEKHQPNITFNLEMITRDPLEIPCLKPEYWTTFENTKGSELASVLRIIKQNNFKSELPKISHLSSEEKLAEEETNIIDCLSYSNDVLNLR